MARVGVRFAPFVGSFFLSVLLLLLACHVPSSHALAGRAKASPSLTKDKLPTLEIAPQEPPQIPPAGVSSKQFYLPTYTLLRAGPVSFIRRVMDSKTYEQCVYKYMNEYNEDSLMTAQGNADAFLAAPDNWQEQKILEQQGRREFYDYGKPLPLERVVLSSVWGSFVVVLFSRVVWQLANGNKNLF